MALQQDIAGDHRDEGGDDTPVHAGSRDQLRVGRCGPLRQVARARKPTALGAAQGPQRHRGQQRLRDIDEQQRHQDFIGAEPRAQDRRDHRPDPAAKGPRHHHQRKDQPVFRRVEGQAHGRAKDRPHDVLAFGADVPDPGAKAQRQADGNQDQWSRLDQQLRARIAGELRIEQRIPEDRADRLERVLAQDREHQPARDHRQDHRQNRRRRHPEA